MKNRSKGILEDVQQKQKVKGRKKMVLANARADQGAELSLQTRAIGWLGNTV